MKVVGVWVGDWIWVGYIVLLFFCGFVCLWVCGFCSTSVFFVCDYKKNQIADFVTPSFIAWFKSRTSHSPHSLCSTHHHNLHHNHNHSLSSHCVSSFIVDECFWRWCTMGFILSLYPICHGTPTSQLVERRCSFQLNRWELSNPILL